MSAFYNYCSALYRPQIFSKNIIVLKIAIITNTIYLNKNKRTLVIDVNLKTELSYHIE